MGRKREIFHQKILFNKFIQLSRDSRKFDEKFGMKKVGQQIWVICLLRDLNSEFSPKKNNRSIFRQAIEVQNLMKICQVSSMPRLIVQQGRRACFSVQSAMCIPPETTCILNIRSLKIISKPPLPAMSRCINDD